MKATITSQTKNPLLHRTEVTGTLTFEKATPSNQELATWVAGQIKKDVPLVVIKKINTLFGKQEATFTAVVYDSAEARQKTEMMTKHLKKKLEEERKKAEEERQAAEEAKKKAEEEAKAAAEAAKSKESPEGQPEEKEAEA